MFSHQPSQRGAAIGGFDTPPTRDLWILLGVLFAVYSLSFFPGVALLPYLMQLSPEVFQSGFLWQLATYAFAGDYDFTFGGGSPIWFLVSLLMIYMFGNPVRRQLGQRNFWWLLAWGILAASVVAVVVQVAMWLAGWLPVSAFTLMQGQRILLTILVAAFATLYGQATIYLMFVLPVRARWFIPLELLLAFAGFLTTKDLAGFLGISTAVGVTYGLLAFGGPRRLMRELRLRTERKILEARLRRMRRKSKLRPVDRDDEGNGGVHRGPWVN